MDRKTREHFARRGVIIDKDSDYGWSTVLYNSNSRHKVSFGEDIAQQFSGIFARPIFSGDDQATLPITLGGSTCFGFCEFGLHENSLLKMLQLIFIFPQHRKSGIGSYILKRLCEGMLVTAHVCPLELYLIDVHDGYRPVVSCIEEVKTLEMQDTKTEKGKKKLLETYKKAGFKEAVLSSSKKTFVTSLGVSLPGLLHLKPFTDS